MIDLEKKNANLSHKKQAAWANFAPHVQLRAKNLRWKCPIQNFSKARDFTEQQNGTMHLDRARRCGGHYLGPHTRCSSVC
jgi:hypothetical protein